MDVSTDYECQYEHTYERLSLFDIAIDEFNEHDYEFFYSMSCIAPDIPTIFWTFNYAKHVNTKYQNYHIGIVIRKSTD